MLNTGLPIIPLLPKVWNKVLLIEKSPFPIPWSALIVDLNDAEHSQLVRWVWINNFAGNILMIKDISIMYVERQSSVQEKAVLCGVQNQNEKECGG